MESYNIFSYKSSEYVKEIAKIGTNSDIQLYHRKDGDTIMTFIEPVKYPEKVSSLTDSIYPSDIAIINARDINRELGEVIISLDLMKKENGFIIANDDKKDLIKKLIKNTNLKNYKFFDGKPMELIDEIKKIKITRNSDKNLTVIDHFFKVRGVGTVALGFVISGRVEKHEKMIISDLDKEIEIKSIQMNDVDQDSASAGSRVGLALKNVEPSDMERGMFLSDKPFEYKNEIDSKITEQNSLNIKLTGDFEIFLSDMMRYQRGKYENNRAVFEKKIPVIKDYIVLSNNNIAPRIFGTINL
jgi:selenocysteine-specific translation elongation factor